MARSRTRDDREVSWRGAGRDTSEHPRDGRRTFGDLGERCAFGLTVVRSATLPLHVETRVVGALSALGDHHGSDAVERFLARVNALPEEDDAFAAELRAEAQAAAKEAVARLRGG